MKDETEELTQGTSREVRKGTPKEKNFGNPESSVILICPQNQSKE